MQLFLHKSLTQHLILRTIGKFHRHLGQMRKSPTIQRVFHPLPVHPGVQKLRGLRYSRLRHADVSMRVNRHIYPNMTESARIGESGQDIQHSSTFPPLDRI